MFVLFCVESLGVISESSLFLLLGNLHYEMITEF